MDVRGGGTVPAQFITTTGSSNGATIRIRKSDANLSVNDKIGAIQFAGDDGTDNYISEFAKIEATVDDATSNSEDGTLKFYTGTNGSSTEKFRITSAGSVGISSTAPKTDVDISQKTGAVALPQGTTAQRPTGSAPYIRKNSTNNALEFYNGTNWVEIITDYFPTGSTTLG